MSSTTWTSKYKFVAVLAASGFMLATTLALASNHPVTTGAQTSPTVASSHVRPNLRT
jgi:adenine/guanine phosphoribosyltransferase-like PRPP-binding protein